MSSAPQVSSASRFYKFNTISYSSEPIMYKANSQQGEPCMPSTLAKKPSLEFGWQQKGFDVSFGYRHIKRLSPLVLLQQLLVVQVGEGGGGIGPGVLKAAAVCVAATQGVCTCSQAGLGHLQDGQCVIKRPVRNKKEVKSCCKASDSCWCYDKSMLWAALLLSRFSLDNSTSVYITVRV